MHKLEVGQVLPELKDTPEGVRFTMTDSGAELLLCFHKPTNYEINEVKAGRVRFGMFVTEDIIFILSKFGDLEWMDAPFHVALTRNLTELQEVEPGQGYSCLVILIDTSTGEVKTLRLVSFNTEFSRRLKHNIENQSKESFNQVEYDSKLLSIMRRYSTRDMVSFSEVNCIIYRDTSILNEVFTFSEAARLWGIDSSTLRKAVENGRLKEGVDYRKSGGVLMVTKEAMLREYGEPKK